MIRKAKFSDIDTIMSIINETVEEMKSYGNTQWDNNYPNNETFINDIKNDSLYVYEEDNYIKGFVCIDNNEAKEYKNLNWSLYEKCMVTHRMAINSKFRNSGIASKLMDFCEELALKNGVRYLKADTYSLNIKMNSFFKKRGYKFIGKVFFTGKEKPFYVYEKILKEK